MTSINCRSVGASVVACFLATTDRLFFDAHQFGGKFAFVERDEIVKVSRMRAVYRRSPTRSKPSATRPNIGGRCRHGKMISMRGSRIDEYR